MAFVLVMRTRVIEINATFYFLGFVAFVLSSAAGGISFRLFANLDTPVVLVLALDKIAEPFYRLGLCDTQIC